MSPSKHEKYVDANLYATALAGHYLHKLARVGAPALDIPMEVAGARLGHRCFFADVCQLLEYPRPYAHVAGNDDL